MAYAFDHINNRVEITFPQNGVDVQDLVDAIRAEEASERGIAYDTIARASGKESLGEGVKVGLTVELLGNWQLHFWETDGGYIAKIAGGNLVGGPGGDPVAYSAGLQVLLLQSASSTVVEVTSGGGGAGLSQDEHDRLMSCALEATAQSIRSRLLQTALETSAQNIGDDIATLRSAADTLAAAVARIESEVHDLGDEAFGRWAIDFATDTMTLYRKDGTELRRFSLTRASGDAPAYGERTPA